MGGAEWRNLSHPRAEAVGSWTRPIAPRRLRPAKKNERFAPMSSTGLSRRLGSPLRSARWPAFAPVEITGFFWAASPQY